MTVTEDQLDRAARNAGIAELKARVASREAEFALEKAEWCHAEYERMVIEWVKQGNTDLNHNDGTWTVNAYNDGVCLEAK